MDSKFIIDTIDSISIQQPKDVVMTHIIDYIDDKLFESKKRIMKSREIIIHGRTVDDKDFLVRIPVDPHGQTITYTGLAAKKEINKLLDTGISTKIV